MQLKIESSVAEVDYFKMDVRKSDTLRFDVLWLKALIACCTSLQRIQGTCDEVEVFTESYAL